MIHSKEIIRFSRQSIQLELDCISVLSEGTGNRIKEQIESCKESIKNMKYPMEIP